MILTKAELTAVIDVNKNYLNGQLAKIIVNQDNTAALQEIDNAVARIKALLDPANNS